MFLRIKKIKNKSYVYLVENKWRKRRKNKVRQKTLKYLGRLYKLDKEQSNKLDINEKDTPEKIIITLIKQELQNHACTETKKNIFEKDNIIVNLIKREVIDKKTQKQICIEINNNFLCSYTLKKLISFFPKKNSTNLQIGKQLANSFESAGIQITKEIFVVLAKKILKTLKN